MGGVSIFIIWQDIQERKKKRGMRKNFLDIFLPSKAWGMVEAEGHYYDTPHQGKKQKKVFSCYGAFFHRDITETESPSYDVTDLVSEVITGS